MNRVNTRPEKSEGEPLDALLGAFFRTEMPSPWPALRRPARSRLSFDHAQVSRRPAYAGRLALAASVGLLFVGSWLLPPVTSRAPRGESLPTLGPASATRGGGLVPVHLQPEKPGTPALEKSKSSLHLEQGPDGRTGIKITVQEDPYP